jgi:hypothetical protein
MEPTPLAPATARIILSRERFSLNQEPSRPRTQITSVKVTEKFIVECRRIPPMLDEWKLNILVLLRMLPPDLEEELQIPHLPAYLGIMILIRREIFNWCHAIITKLPDLSKTLSTLINRVVDRFGEEEEGRTRKL